MHLLWNAKCVHQRGTKQLFKECQDLFCLAEWVQRGLSFSCLGFFLICFTIVFQNTIQNATTEEKDGDFEKYRREFWELTLSQESAASDTLTELKLKNLQEERHNKQLAVIQWPAENQRRWSLPLWVFCLCGAMRCCEKLWTSFCPLQVIASTQQYPCRWKLLLTVHCKDGKALTDLVQEPGVRINFGGKPALLTKQFTSISRTVISFEHTKDYLELQNYFTSERGPEVILSSLCCRFCKCHLGPEKKKKINLKLIKGSLL